MFRVFSESMLANVIAFEGTSIPLKELKQAVGRGRGTIIGRGMVFHTHVQEHLSEEDTRRLIEHYSRLVGEYSKGELDRNLIHDIKLRNDVSSRVSMIRNIL